jgi:hypothetical protein
MGERRLVGSFPGQIDIAAVHRPGESHVEKAQFLRFHLLALPLLVLFCASFFPAQLKGKTFPGVSTIVKQQFFVDLGFCVRPKERAEDNWVFQSFALVDSDDLDRVIVTQSIGSDLPRPFIPRCSRSHEEADPGQRLNALSASCRSSAVEKLVKRRSPQVIEPDVRTLRHEQWRNIAVKAPSLHLVQSVKRSSQPFRIVLSSEGPGVETDQGGGGAALGTVARDWDAWRKRCSSRFLGGEVLRSLDDARMPRSPVRQDHLRWLCLRTRIAMSRWRRNSQSAPDAASAAMSSLTHRQTSLLDARPWSSGE